MKKLIYIIIFLFSLTGISNSQNLTDSDGGRLREKMMEYIQGKLGLNKDEASKFESVFTNYLRDLRSTNQQYKGDRLVLQDKVVELRLRYRDQFKPIIGEKRSNDVFNYERDFVKQAREELQNRNDGRANKRF
ncbi:MAG TPA: hypothetical protein VFQ58_09870 [Flavisolibacter sp.]|nr:hypothetical protein [Flavisolibacter sp.]